jgi:hypothetical protein
MELRITNCEITELAKLPHKIVLGESTKKLGTWINMGDFWQDTKKQLFFMPNLLACWLFLTFISLMLLVRLSGTLDKLILMNLISKMRSSSCINNLQLSHLSMRIKYKWPGSQTGINLN